MARTAHDDVPALPDDGLSHELLDRERRLADPLLDGVRVYRRAGEALLLVAELSVESGDLLSMPLPRGLEMSPAEIFE